MVLTNVTTDIVRTVFQCPDREFPFRSYPIDQTGSERKSLKTIVTATASV